MENVISFMGMLWELVLLPLHLLYPEYLIISFPAIFMIVYFVFRYIIIIVKEFAPYDSSSRTF